MGLSRPAVAVACLSPCIPVVVVVLVILGTWDRPIRKQDGWMIELAVLACALGLLLGVVGCVLGVVARTKMIALPPALLGILVNAAVGVVALFVLALNGLAG